MCVTQVAACELLHSLVVYMVGKSAQMVEGENSLPPMYKLHKRLFPVLLRLACDVDQVCGLLQDHYPRHDSYWSRKVLKYYGMWQHCKPDRERLGY